MWTYASQLNEEYAFTNKLLIYKDDLTENAIEAYHLTWWVNVTNSAIIADILYSKSRWTYNSAIQYYAWELVQDWNWDWKYYMALQDTVNNDPPDWTYWTTTISTTWSKPVVVTWYAQENNILNVNHTNAYSYEALAWEIIEWTQELNIIDIVEFDWAVFVLTDTHIYFSRITFDDNTHFYPLDRLEYKKGTKLIPIWESMIVVWKQNKLITKTSVSLLWTEWITSYVMKDLDYNWNLFSKYSFKYTEGILYPLQDDRRLMNIQIAKDNSSSYRVVSNEISVAYKYLFENVTWECFVDQYWKYLNFLFVDWWTSENYQFDIQLKIW